MVIGFFVVAFSVMMADQALVLDIGSDCCKAGLSGDSDPKLIVRSVIARQPAEGDVSSIYKVSQQKRSILRLKVDETGRSIVGLDTSEFLPRTDGTRVIYM